MALRARLARLIRTIAGSNTRQAGDALTLSISSALIFRGWPDTRRESSAQFSQTTGAIFGGAPLATKYWNWKLQCGQLLGPSGHSPAHPSCLAVAFGYRMDNMWRIVASP